MINKRGLSGVVTTLILILISLVAVGIIWVVIANVIGEGTQNVNLGKFTISLEISNVSVSDSGTVDVTVRRNPGEGDLHAIKFSLENDSGTTVIDRDSDLGELGSKVFNLPYPGHVKSVSITPVLGSNGGVVGSTLDKKEFVFDGYIDNMDDVSDWSVLHDVNGTSPTFSSSSGVLEFHVTFDNASNEYATLKKDFTGFVPTGKDRFIEIRYKKEENNCSSCHFNLWLLDCNNVYGPRISLGDGPSGWQTKIIDTYQMIWDDINGLNVGEQFCNSTTYTGKVTGIQFLIDDNPNEAGDPTPADATLYVDYIKHGEKLI